MNVGGERERVKVDHICFVFLGFWVISVHIYIVKVIGFDYGFGAIRRFERKFAWL